MTIRFHQWWFRSMILNQWFRNKFASGKSVVSRGLTQEAHRDQCGALVSFIKLDKSVILNYYFNKQTHTHTQSNISLSS